MIKKLFTLMSIAAVIATIDLSFLAASTMHSPKTFEYVGFPFAVSPFAGLNGAVPWYSVGFDSANEQPLPFFVTTWRSTGPFMCFILPRKASRSGMSCPSTGPRYLNPSCSKYWSAIRNLLRAPFILKPMPTAHSPKRPILEKPLPT